MNEQGRPHDGPATISYLHPDCTPELGGYGGQPAMRCPHCGHVSPSELHLRRHLERECCGRWMRWAG